MNRHIWRSATAVLYHDAKLSNKTFYRNVKATELHYDADGTIRTIDPFVSETT